MRFGVVQELSKTSYSVAILAGRAPDADSQFNKRRGGGAEQLGAVCVPCARLPVCSDRKIKVCQYLGAEDGWRRVKK